MLAGDSLIHGLMPWLPRYPLWEPWSGSKIQHQLIATLTGAVLTFSELEALVSSFTTKSDISMVERVKWSWKEAEVLPIL
jgi:hypothetical protein